MKNSKQLKENVYKSAQAIALTELLLEIKEYKTVAQVRGCIYSKLDELEGDLK